MGGGQFRKELKHMKKYPGKMKITLIDPNILLQAMEDAIKEPNKQYTWNRELLYADKKIIQNETQDKILLIGESKE